MRKDDLRFMPRTRSLIADRGVRFDNAFVTRSLCCPSRATILRGQYAHNHKVWVNTPPTGSFHKFRNAGLEWSTVATWLDGAGYDTVLTGKYLNKYDDTTYVPPGWDRWNAYLGDYYDPDTYRLNQNGKIVAYSRSQTHDTDNLADKADYFIRQTSSASGASGAPFFMHLSPFAPHFPAYYPDRHAGMFSDASLPKGPSFNERDVSDKPGWVRENAPLTSGKTEDMTRFYRNRLRALQSVDEMVGRLVGALRDTGELSNTYIVLTSDNGIYLGEHRLEAKAAAYEEAIRVPLLVRGPGVAQGRIRNQLVLNNDLAPTFADLAGASEATPAFVDGRSLAPLLSTFEGSSPPWRSAFLIEHRSSSTEYDNVRAIPAYDAVRTAGRLYVEYATGEKELYNLALDPHQLTNRYPSASPRLRQSLQARLDALTGCAGAECRRAEGGS